MGKKIQYIGRYVMDGVVLGKGNFARVELATHGVTQTKVSHPLSPQLYSTSHLINHPSRHGFAAFCTRAVHGI